MVSNSASSFSKTPKLSILLATKDQATTLERCLQGIQSQTFEDYELIILNDGSTDDTPLILERWKHSDPRIRLFRNATAQGVIPAYQKLQDHARGEFIWHAASDDFCVDKDFLTNGFRLLTTAPKAAGFFCNTLRIMMPARKPHGIWGTTGTARYIAPKTFLSQFLRGKIVIPGCATVIRKDVFIKQGGFQEEAGALCDLLINSKLGYLGKFFGLEHQSRCSRKNPLLERNLRELSERILTQYNLYLNQCGIHSTDNMSSRDFLFFPLRNSWLRFFIKIWRKIFQAPDVSL